MMDPVLKFLLGALSVAPWVALLAWHSRETYPGPLGRLWMRYGQPRLDSFAQRHFSFGVYLGVASGMLSAWLLTKINVWIFQDPMFVMQTDKPVSWALQIAFIQAGLLEELIKCLFAFLLCLLLAWQKNSPGHGARTNVSKNYEENKVKTGPRFSARPQSLFAPNAPLVAASVGLGFAWIENMEYIPALLQIQGFLSVFLSRTLAALAHLLFGLNFGLFLYTARATSWPGRAAAGLFVSVFLHGVFDFFSLPQGLFAALLSHIFFVTVAFFLFQWFRNLGLAEKTL